MDNHAVEGTPICALDCCDITSNMASKPWKVMAHVYGGRAYRS